MVRSIPNGPKAKNTVDISSNEIATRLYEDIIVGVFPFGNKLVEERLTLRYETKRHLLREAFGVLEELGFVERIPNRGVHVREPHPKEVRELYKMRALLERNAAGAMELPAPLETIDKMRRIHALHSKAIREFNLRDVLHLNTEFHRTQYEICKDGTLVAAIEFYATRTHLITALKFGDAAAMENVISQHEAIIAAMEGNDHEVLKACVDRHFNLTRVAQYENEYELRHGRGSAVPAVGGASTARAFLSR